METIITVEEKAIRFVAKLKYRINDDSSGKYIYDAFLAGYNEAKKTTTEKDIIMTQKTQNVTDRIKTYEDACNELGLLPYPHSIATMTDDELAYYKLKVIVKALNEGWEADWTNRCQAKFYPYFETEINGSLSGLVSVSSSHAFSYANTPFGSRLAFKSRELAEYAGKQFIDIYKAFIL